MHTSFPWCWRIRTFGFGALLLAGCGGSSVEPPPALATAGRYDPAAMTATALQTYDTNKNGTFDPAELDACPSLKRLAGKKPLAAADLTKRFEAYVTAGANAVSPASALVTLNGQPLDGATVTLEPEKFMPTGFPVATGTTDATGYVEFSTPAGRGVSAGFYIVRVSKQSGGAEQVPAKYNSASKQGVEVFDDGRSAGGAITLNLTGG